MQIFNVVDKPRRHYLLQVFQSDIAGDKLVRKFLFLCIASQENACRFCSICLNSTDFSADLFCRKQCDVNLLCSSADQRGACLLNH